MLLCTVVRAHQCMERRRVHVIRSQLTLQAFIKFVIDLLFLAEKLHATWQTELQLNKSTLYRKKCIKTDATWSTCMCSSGWFCMHVCIAAYTQVVFWVHEPTEVAACTMCVYISRCRLIPKHHKNPHGTKETKIETGSLCFDMGTLFQKMSTWK